MKRVPMRPQRPDTRSTLAKGPFGRVDRVSGRTGSPGGVA